MRRFKIILTCLFMSLVLITQNLFGRNPNPLFLNNIRSLAMGGTGVASASGNFSYLYNPALLTKEKFSLTLPNVQIEFSKKFLDIINFVVDHREDFRNLNESTSAVSNLEKAEIVQNLRTEAVAFDNIWYRATTIPSVGIVVNQLAFGLYNISQFASKIDVGIIVPKVKVYTINDLIFSLGYGYQINETFALGIGAKIIRRFESPIIKIQVEEMAHFNDVLAEGIDEMEKGKTGFTFDAGALYHLNDKLKLAVAAQNFLGQMDSVLTCMNLKLGMMHQYNKNWTFAADLEDLFNRNREKFVNKIHLGCEYTLPFLDLRFGISQGYPAFGFGVNFSVVEFEYTFYTREVTDAPGAKGESYHLIGLRLGWL